MQQQINGMKLTVATLKAYEDLYCDFDDDLKTLEDQ